MPLRFPNAYPRSTATVALTGLVLWFAFSSVRVKAWTALHPVFEGMEATVFGVLGKTWGVAFALAEATHLLGMALLGGAILVSDGRLLGLLLRDVPVQLILGRTHRLFVTGLLIVIASGIFMACGVAMKIYYLPVFWFKMLALVVGVLFTFAIKRPLLAEGVENLNPWVVRVVAAASLTTWLTVAAAGRWIGFSG